VVSTPETADEPVLVQLKKNEKFKKWQSKADAARPASSCDLRKQVNELYRIAGVIITSDNLVGTYSRNPSISIILLPICGRLGRIMVSLPC
jgi:hypothetical protein